MFSSIHCVTRSAHERPFAYKPLYQKGKEGDKRCHSPRAPGSCFRRWLINESNDDGGCHLHSPHLYSVPILVHLSAIRQCKPMSYHWRKKEKHYLGRTSAGHLKMMTENSTTLWLPNASLRGASDLWWSDIFLNIHCIETLFLCQTWKMK